MRIKVLKAFDYTPSAERRVTIAFTPDGPTQGLFTVTREAGEQAIAAGCAELVSEDEAPPARAPRQPKPQPPEAQPPETADGPEA
jgi:hypothetical protein